MFRVIKTASANENTYPKLQIQHSQPLQVSKKLTNERSKLSKSQQKELQALSLLSKTIIREAPNHSSLSK